MATVINEPMVKDETAVFEEIMQDFDPPWVIIVWDDDVNTMEHVIGVFMDYFKLSQESATIKMLEVHQLGKSIITSGPRDEMVLHKQAMNSYKLQASIEQAV